MQIYFFWEQNTLDDSSTKKVKLRRRSLKKYLFFSERCIKTTNEEFARSNNVDLANSFSFSYHFQIRFLEICDIHIIALQYLLAVELCEVYVE